MPFNLISHHPTFCPVMGASDVFYNSHISKKERLKNCSTKIKSKLIAISKVPIRQVASAFQKIHDLQIPLKLQYLELGLGIVHIMGNKFTGLMKVSNHLLKMVRQTFLATLDFILNSKVAFYVLNTIKLISIAAVPFALYDIAANLIELIKGSLSEKIDASLLVTADIGIIGECVATFATGLHKFGAFSAQAIQWTTPVYIVSLALSFASALLYAKEGLEHTFVLGKLLTKSRRKIPGDSIDNYRPLFEYLIGKRDKFLKKHFKVNPEQLRGRLCEIWDKSKEIIDNPKAALKDKQEAFKRVAKVVKTLKQQKIVRISVAALLGISCLFAIAAGAAFLLSPTSPIAYGLMLGGLAIVGTATLIGYLGNRRFRKQMGIVSEKGPMRRFCERKFVVVKNTTCRYFLKILEAMRLRKKKRLAQKFTPIKLPVRPSSLSASAA